MNKVELTGFEWHEKFIEGAYFALVDIKEGRLPSEGRMSIIHTIFKNVYFNGNLPLYKTVTAKKVEKVEQGGLFDNSGKEKEQKSDKSC